MTRADARGVALGILLARERPSRVVSYDALKSSRDRALALDLVNGTVRWRRLLLSYVSSFSDRPVEELSPSLRNALLLGAYQLLILGMPPHAAVDSVVRCLKSRGERAYCNGCLRSISRNLGHVSLPRLRHDPVSYMSERYSYPDWIPSYFMGKAGVPWALAMCRQGNRLPSLSLRVNMAKTDSRSLLEQLTQAGYDAVKGQLHCSVQVTGGRAVKDFPGYRQGLFFVQDEGAMVISLVLAPEKGDSVWDVCAAPGGKTTHLAELVGPTGQVLATDIDAKRASMVTENAQRMGVSNVCVREMDATKDVPEQDFDRVLLDAPCSGLGVLSRNPDLRWNRRKSDIEPMARRQKALLDNVVGKVKAGGVLVYSTCTLTDEENEMVWNEFLRTHPWFSPEDPVHFPGGELMTQDARFRGPGYRYLSPTESRTDGFFVARARRLPINEQEPDSRG